MRAAWPCRRSRSSTSKARIDAWWCCRQAWRLSTACHRGSRSHLRARRRDRLCMRSSHRSRMHQRRHRGARTHRAQVHRCSHPRAEHRCSHRRSTRRSAYSSAPSTPSTDSPRAMQPKQEARLAAKAGSRARLFSPSSISSGTRLSAHLLLVPRASLTRRRQAQRHSGGMLGMWSLRELTRRCPGMRSAL